MDVYVRGVNVNEFLLHLLASRIKNVIIETTVYAVNVSQVLHPRSGARKSRTLCFRT